MKTCAEFAVEMFKKMDYFRGSDLLDSANLFSLLDKFKECSDFPKSKKQVWQ